MKLHIQRNTFSLILLPGYLQEVENTTIIHIFFSLPALVWLLVAFSFDFELLLLVFKLLSFASSYFIDLLSFGFALAPISVDDPVV